MKRNFSRGSVDTMIDAFQNKIVELGGDLTPETDDVINSASYIDDSGVFGEPGATIDYNFAQDYWEREHNNDPSLSQYGEDGFETWWSDTLQWLSPVDSSSTSANNTDVFAAIDDDPTYLDRYIHNLMGDVDSVLEESGQIDSYDWNTSDNYLTLITVSGGDVTDYEIPFEDLTKNFDKIQDDVKYIVKAVLGEDYSQYLDIHSNMPEFEFDDIYESTNINASRDDLYFGQEQADKYGDLICEQLAGKTVSKRKDKAKEPGGLIYEADKLGIDMWDLLEALEGLCYQGKASEIDDSTYQVYGCGDISDDIESCDTVNAAQGEYDKWDELSKKQVRDSDGFFTDYTLYHNPFTDQYICMFGDSDVYQPDPDYADFECDTEEEAYEWFNSYTGIDDDDDDSYVEDEY